MIKSMITEAVKKVLSDKYNLIDPNVDFVYEMPKDKKFGDLSLTVAMPLARILKSAPRKIAQDIVDNFSLDSQIIEKIDVAGPGFINFFISNKYYQNQLKSIVKDGALYEVDKEKSKRVLLEFVSANPTGPLTIGHGRQAVWGGTVVNFLRYAGFDVDTEYYFNDAGNQMRVLGESARLRYLQILGKQVDFPEDYYQGEYIVDIAEKIVDNYGDGKVGEEWVYFKEFAEKEIFADIDGTLNRLGIKFDNYFNEKTLYEDGKIDFILKEFKDKKLAYESEGATWFKATEFGADKDRVIIKSSGEPTYRLPDIAYHTTKFQRDYDCIMDIFGADHHSTYPDVLAGLQALGYDTGKVKVLIHQFVTLVENGEKVKMSTRKANFTTLDELMDEVGIDVTRYFFLMRGMNSHLNFDLGLAKTQSDENPVFYVQYAHARICSMLEFGREQGMDVPDFDQVDLTLLNEEEEIDLIKKLMLFSKTVQFVLSDFEPYHICNYLEELAAIFHKFYHNHRVITDNIELSKARLILVKATRIILRQGLDLLGISAPEKM